jgi:DNA-directed RNA polymerase subunit RPC12/RpoP
MDKIKIKKRIFSSKILCTLIGHKILVTRNITNHFKEYKCSVCGLELTNDLKGQKIFLTPELKDINEALIRIEKNKNKSV